MYNAQNAEEESSHDDDDDDDSPPPAGGEGGGGWGCNVVVQDSPHYIDSKEINCNIHMKN